MTPRQIIIAAAVLLLVAVAAWGAWTVAAHRSEERTSALEDEIATIHGKLEELGAQRDKAAQERDAALVQLQESEGVLSEQLVQHRQIVAQINARLRSIGQQLEAPIAGESPEGPSEALDLGIEAPEGMTLDLAWTGWRSCESALGAALDANHDCRATVEADTRLIEASRDVEAQLRQEIEARNDLEAELRSTISRRKWSGRLKMVGAALAGYGAAHLSGQ